MGANMYEVRCYGVRPLNAETSIHCYASWLYKKEDANNIASEPCIFCNSNAWEVSETSLTAKEYFARMLKDPTGTIGYHVTHRDITLDVQAPLD